MDQNHVQGPALRAIVPGEVHVIHDLQRLHHGGNQRAGLLHVSVTLVQADLLQLVARRHDTDNCDAPHSPRTVWDYGLLHIYLLGCARAASTVWGRRRQLR